MPPNRTLCYLGERQWASAPQFCIESWGRASAFWKTGNALHFPKPDRDRHPVSLYLIPVRSTFHEPSALEFGLILA
jgi:hypothetical protein